MLRTYPQNGIDVQINALGGYAFQFTNSISQLLSEDSAFSKIDLGECERKIKESNGLDPNISLIFLKFENIGHSKKERDIQYEVYSPIDYTPLNLSVCENEKVNLNIPIKLSDELLKLIQNILDQGYDPFDENGKFYREICTPYNSENGTDVLLDDREEYIYSTIQSEMSCPSGCEMSSYSLDDKYMTCECGTNDTGIVELDVHHITAKNVKDSFLSTLKNSNYKVMRCYNLVFNFKIFCHNYGSIITLIFFIIYVLFMIYYIIKDISPLKVSISKLLFEEQQRKNVDNPNYIKPQPYLFKEKSSAKSVKSKKTSKSKKSSKSKKKQAKSVKGSFPPKKKGNIRVKAQLIKNDKDQTQLIDLDKKEETIKEKKEEVKNNNNMKRRKSIAEFREEMGVKTTENLLNAKTFSEFSDGNVKKRKKVTFEEKDEKNKQNFDNYELNNMEYYDACKFDKRTCLKTYWTILLREHYVLITFLSRNDYNLFYVKIERFFILICTELTMNGMFFVHETMYKKQTGDTSFAQKIPQIIFSLLVTHAVEIILCYLSLTDKHYYEIKALPQKEKMDQKITDTSSKKEKNEQKNKKALSDKENRDQKIIDILDLMRRKLIAFFIFSFLLFLFHWYFISAFCAVYQNTQLIFLRDSAISILTSLIDPFITYGLTCLLRALSLSPCVKRKLSCVYKVSDLLPLF